MLKNLRKTLITNHIEDSTNKGRLWGRDLKLKAKPKKENIIMIALGCMLLCALFLLSFWAADIGATKIIDFKINQLW